MPEKCSRFRSTMATTVTYYKYDFGTFRAERCPVCGAGVRIQEVASWAPYPESPGQTVVVE